MTFEELRRVPWRDVTSLHMDELRLLFGGRCKKCGAKRSGSRNGRKTGPLEFAHSKPTGLCGMGRGLKARFFDILRNLDCYVLLCTRCHRVMDNAKWIEKMIAASSRPAEAIPA